MSLSIAPSGIIKVAAGSSVALGATGTVSVAGVPERFAIWETLTGCTANANQVCKTLASGFGNAFAVSKDEIVIGQVGAFQVDAPVARQRIGFSANSSNQKFGFEFIPSNGKVNIIVSGAVVKETPCNAGQACRIEIFNRKVTWKVNNVIVHFLDNSALDCSYRIRAELDEINTCLLNIKFSSSQIMSNTVLPSCFTWNATGGTIVGSGANAIYTAPIVAGVYFVNVSAPGAGTLEARVEVSSLAFSSIACGGKVIEGTIVEFTANGGQQAQLTADGGVVIDPTHWLAPSVEGFYNLVYAVNGEEQRCQIEVVRRLKIEGVENELFDFVVPNQQIQFVSNCADTRYSSPDCPECINALGFFVAPDLTQTDSFGMAEVEIIAKGCGQEIGFLVIIDPVYPSPEVGGVHPTKTLPVTEKYNVTKHVSEGGSPTYYDDGNAPEMIWKLSYSNLALCPVGDIPEGYKLNCETDAQSLSNRQNVQRLDNFHRLVRGISRRTR